MTKTYYRVTRYSNTIRSQAVLKATDKTITLPSGRRENLRSEYHIWYPDINQAAERIRERLKKTVAAGKAAERELAKLQQQIAKGKVKTVPLEF